MTAGGASCRSTRRATSGTCCRRSIRRRPANPYRRLTEAGARTIALAAHPGGTATDLGHEGSGLTNVMLRTFVMPMQQPPALGVLSVVRAATDPAARGGQLYGPRWIVAGPPRLETPARHARRPDDARRLWLCSEELTGVTFDM